MPEGDTIHRAARRLHDALAGREVIAFRAAKLQGLRPRPNARVEQVEAHGKHLLVHFNDGLVLDTHMMMAGAWHVYRAGERWRRQPHLARVVIETSDATAVCFQATVVRTYFTASESTPLDDLGPRGPRRVTVSRPHRFRRHGRNGARASDVTTAGHRVKTVADGLDAGAWQSSPAIASQPCPR